MATVVAECKNQPFLAKSFLLMFALAFYGFVSCNIPDFSITEKKLFNEGWTFQRMENGDSETGFTSIDFKDTNWEDVTIPHTPKIEPLPVNDQWQGVCWYQKKFKLPEEWNGQKIFLKFEAAMNVAEVWLNGQKKIEHIGGYLPFVVDISEAFFGKETDNIIAVRLDNTDNPITGPKPLKILDFNMYGGIYRNVWLIVKNPLHITDPISAAEKASGGVFVRYPKVSEEKASVSIQTHIANEYDESKKFEIRHSLLNDRSEIVVQTDGSFELKSNAADQFESLLEVDNPALWSPAHPNLYTLQTTIILDGDEIDKEQFQIGIKSMEFKGQDFHLNGEKTILRGVNRHQEYPFVGYALSDNAQFRDAKKIKEAGFDLVRLSHYPHSTSFMEACDEYGIMTIDAILGWQYFSEDEAFQKHIFQTAKNLIRRDRNHASVLAWEVSLNESWMPEPFIDSLQSIAHSEYPGDQCFTAGWQEYGYDIFLQARQHRLKHYNTDLDKPYSVSEYGDWEYYAMNAGLDQDNWSDLIPEERSSRQLRTDGPKRLLQQATNIQEAHNDNLNTPAFSDSYWVMFDYTRGYANDLEASGIMDIFRIPKPSYYFYQSQRGPTEPFGKPMVQIASNFTDNSEQSIRVFSNCEEVELLQDGKSLGRKQSIANKISTNLTHPPFEFISTGYPGSKLEAVGYINNEITTRHTIEQAENASQLMIEADDSGIAIENNDLFFVYIYLLDPKNNLVEQTGGIVKLELSGDVFLMNPNDIQFEVGIATALLKTGNKDNFVKIRAEFGELNAELKIPLE